MPDRVADWTALTEALYPIRDAASWDRAGLQVGAPDDDVTGVLVSLDVTDAVLDEAAEGQATLVVAHHPLLFRGLERLTPDTAAGRLALQAARRGVGIYAAHTNLDVAERGTSTPIASLLGLEDPRPLAPQPDPAQEIVKLTTFVPREDTGKVVAALSAAGAGVIGEYTECSFRVPGTGTFRPSQAADPVVGERGQRTEVAEDRVEVEVSRSRVPAAVDALIASHPYEEVAYDLYQLVDDTLPMKGLGVVGDLAEPMTLTDLADILARNLPAPHLRVAGELGRQVRRVAVCGGAGDSLIDAAHRAGADVYVTGDLRHHPVLDALTMGLALVDAGHYATEAAALPELHASLSRAASDRGLRAPVTLSRLSTDPWADYRPPGGP